MRLALVNNELSEAQPGLKGICPLCAENVSTKCGPQRIHHWYHPTKENCDSWAEKETEWHIGWKRNFPIEWHECPMRDLVIGERHFADVRTPHGLVLEFQHSALNPQERISREQFYKNMIWIADGSRRIRDFTRFVRGFADNNCKLSNAPFLLSFPDELFPKDWLHSPVPVVFDFSNVITADEHQHLKEVLWCMVNNFRNREVALLGIPKQNFINAITNPSQPLSAQSLINVIWESIQKQKEVNRIQSHINANSFYRHSSRPRRKCRL